MKFEARTVVFSETINEKGGFYSSMYIYKLILESGLYMIHIRRSNLDVRFLILEMKTKCKTNLNIWCNHSWHEMYDLDYITT